MASVRALSFPLWALCRVLATVLTAQPWSPLHPPPWGIALVTVALVLHPPPWGIALVTAQPWSPLHPPPWGIALVTVAPAALGHRPGHRCRLHHNVIRTGLRRISMAYSRISLQVGWLRLGQGGL